MPRVKNPLPDHTDAEVLRFAALTHDRQARRVDPPRAAAYRAVAARLRAIARRVPLWTDNKEISR